MYQRIMDDVIENCQVTFEEDGVNQQTLDELRKVSLLSLVSLVAFSQHVLRHFGLAMTNVEAFLFIRLESYKDFNAVEFLTLWKSRRILLPLKIGWAGIL